MTRKSSVHPRYSLAVPDELPADLQHLIEKLAAELPELPSADEAARRFEWLLDLLILRGQLPASFKRLAEKVQADRGVKLRLAGYTNKYEVPSPDVPCAELIPLCRARCCSFEVALSRQDLEERVVPFVVDRPYLLPRAPDGRCACMDEGGACTIYDKRPGTCREYDCREDARVWIDYAKRIPAP
jgi:Fe-S-cluster containining protein